MIIIKTTIQQSTLMVLALYGYLIQLYKWERMGKDLRKDHHLHGKRNVKDAEQERN